MSLRALVVDDNEGFTDVARGVLEREGIIVVGVAKNSDEAVRLAQDLYPDVVLVDIDLGEESGFDLVHRLGAEADVGANAILISTHAEEDFADLIAESPALGFLAKSRLSAGAILDMIRGTDAGGMDPETGGEPPGP
ncbi:MAG TPA: response regulator [Actinomycetota bacterium]|nr:response regulator [Actinomycetota bacterium]